MANRAVKFGNDPNAYSDTQTANVTGDLSRDVRAGLRRFRGSDIMWDVIGTFNSQPLKKDSTTAISANCC
jgi:hypothetical protein